LKKNIEGLGGAIFIAYSFFDFFIIFAIMIATLYEGAHANEVDLYFKEYLMKLMKNIVETRELAVERVFFEQNEQINIFRKQPDGTYLSYIDGSIH
jgi:hypothetical protein